MGQREVTLAILVGGKGRGSNMAAILAACASGAIPARPVAVVGTKEGSPALLRAQAHGTPTFALDPKQEDYALRLRDALSGADWICLAGYLSLLPKEIVQAWPNRIINVHPALLPKFGGKGMYGIHVHQAVLDAGEQESGCTIHYVTEQYDEGAVILQKRCEVRPDDTPETLADRVLELEHSAYVEALQKLVSTGSGPTNAAERE